MAKHYDLKVDRTTALTTIERALAVHQIQMTRHENSVVLYQGEQDLGTITLADHADGTELVIADARAGLAAPPLLVAFSAAVLLGLVYYLPHGLGASQILIPLVGALVISVGLWRLVAKGRALKRTTATALDQALAPLQLAAPRTVPALAAANHSTR